RPVMPRPRPKRSPRSSSSRSRPIPERRRTYPPSIRTPSRRCLPPWKRGASRVDAAAPEPTIKRKNHFEQPASQSMVLAARPFQVFGEEVERLLAVDFVRPVEVGDRRAVADPHDVVESADLGVFIAGPLGGKHTVVVAGFHLEGSRRDRPGHL